MTFIEQGNLYRLFANFEFFSGGLGDGPVLTAIKQLPAGMNTAYRYNRFYPDKPGNTAFAEAYNGLVKQEPTNWAWQNSLACQFIVEALKRTGGKTDFTRLLNEAAARTPTVPVLAWADAAEPVVRAAPAQA